MSDAQNPIYAVIDPDTGACEYIAHWPEACHEHINDSITEHNIDGASKWVVRELCTKPKKLTPPDGWAEAVGLAKIMAQLSKPLSERRAEILAQAILDMDAKIKEQK